ncbi:hypothetical protein FPRO04_09945 [Fusarium proliferatum]|nr:hypothetical protein FPRO04_09945 [Fusarium proliferatum]
MSATTLLKRRSVSNSNPELKPIPGPKRILCQCHRDESILIENVALPLLGNLFDFDFNNLTKSLGELGKIHGPIYSLTFGASTEIMVTSREIAHELCDESRFCKLPGGALDKMKEVVGDGLFTAETSNPKWAIAHRIVTPLFGTMRIRGMFDDMKDICEQMCLRWARFGPDEPLNVCDNMTKLTLDTIALCTIDYRFNSFYRENGATHPFAAAVVDVMTESFTQSNLPDFVNNYVRFRAMAKYKRQAAELRRQTEELIAARRQNPVDRDDLLNAMLNAKDPRTGDGLSPESIVDNLLTFLIAGHETTSSLLSFCFYYLLENPDVLRKVQQEVDTVVGSDTFTVEHLSNMPYLEAVLRETLRLRDPGPGFYVKPLKDDVVAGKYAVKKDQPLFIVFDSVHRDESTYGADADEFCPERMLKDSFDKLPPCAWKPFGNGVRACVGRPFAMQQAMLAVAMVVHKFDLIKDESYTLRYHVTMTVRPVGFNMKVRIRQGQRATDLAMGLHQGHGPEASAAAGRPFLKRLASEANDDKGNESKMVVLYASNSGSCEALAYRLAAEATERGFGIRAVDIVNNAVDRMPVGIPVIIITASYNGEPADDAEEFVTWLKSLETNRLNGVKFTVFGNGHRDWANTLFAVPRLIDSELSRCGAQRITPMGVSDTCDSNDPFSDFERWIDEKLFQTLGTPHGLSVMKNGDGAGPREALQVSLGQPPRVTMRKGYVRAIVTEAHSLSNPGVPEKRHLELLLPKDFNYKAGDHVYVLPRNNSRDVVRALNFFGLGEDTLITIRNTARKLSLGLPLDAPIGATDLLGAYVELGRTATLKNLHTLIDAAGHESRNRTKASLLSLAASDTFKAEIQDKNVSILDLLERFPDIDLSLSSFLSMLVQLRPRAYSFSSAPDWKPGHATLTYTVVDFADYRTQEMNGDSKGKAAGSDMVVHRQGLASGYLSSLGPGNSLYVSLHSASPYFCLPKNNSLPVIMVGAGTGLAPFRAFLQERRLAAEDSKSKLGPALLFFGCRGPGLDSLYSIEMEAYEAMGIVQMRRAYSRDPSATGAQGCRYVTEKLERCRDEIVRLWVAGAKVLVCGGKKMANDVQEVLGPMLLETDQNRGETAVKTVVEWRAGLDKGRYVEEVYV